MHILVFQLIDTLLCSNSSNIIEQHNKLYQIDLLLCFYKCSSSCQTFRVSPMKTKLQVLLNLWSDFTLLTWALQGLRFLCSLVWRTECTFIVVSLFAASSQLSPLCFTWSNQSLYELAFFQVYLTRYSRPIPIYSNC